MTNLRNFDLNLLLVLDGVPVYERLDPQFGVGFDPITLESVRVLSGFIPPEFGLRSGGVIEVRSRGASVDSWSGLLDAGAGTYNSQALSGLVQGPLGRDASVTLSLGGERSQRFLDPVSLDNLHNRGFTGGGQAELIWASGANLLTLRGGHMRSPLDVPNNEEQEAAGQDQRQRLGQSFGTLTWQRSWSVTARALRSFHAWAAPRQRVRHAALRRGGSRAGPAGTAGGGHVRARPASFQGGRRGLGGPPG